MASKGLLNSRVKDYYDIWMLSRSVEFDGAELRGSIAATFGRRSTKVPASRPLVLSNEYSQRRDDGALTAFVKRLGASGLEAPDSLVDIVDAISMFIMPRPVLQPRHSCSV